MWADTLFSLERGHLMRLGLWAGISILLGTFVLTWLMVRRLRAPMLQHFAIQTAAWGVVNAAIVAWAWRGLEMRDYAGAQKLLNVLWLNTGLDLGYVAIGITLAITGWIWGRRVGAVGAGAGVVVQGLALTLLDLRLIFAIGPMQ